MRLLSLVLVVIALFGCSSSVDGEKAPTAHACAAVFAGTWHVVGTTKDKCNGAVPQPINLTITINEALTKMEAESPDGTSDSLSVDPSSTELVSPCDYFAGAIIKEGNTATQTTVIEFLKPGGLETSVDSLAGLTTIKRYDSADWSAQHTDATPICKLSYDTSFSR